MSPGTYELPGPGQAAIHELLPRTEFSVTIDEIPQIAPPIRCSGNSCLSHSWRAR